MEKRTPSHNRLHGWHLIALAAALAVTALTIVFLQPNLWAQETTDAVTGLTLTSDAAGEMAVSWDTPGQTPTDYRVNWGKSSRELSRPLQGATYGNAYPTTNSHPGNGPR